MEPNKDSGAKQERQSAASGSPARRQRAADGADRMPLPPELVRIVFSHLYSDLRDTGCAVMAPCDAARDIAAAALSCRGFAAAARGAFADLTGVLDAAYKAGTSTSADLLDTALMKMTPRQQALVRMAEFGISWAEWDALVAAPESLELPLLKKAAQSLGIKAKLIKRIFRELGLPGPMRLPVRLWRACALERCTRVNDRFLRDRYVDELPIDFSFFGLVCDAAQLAQWIERGQELEGFSAPAGAPPLTVSLTMAEARAALLARGIRTRADLAALEKALDAAWSARTVPAAPRLADDDEHDPWCACDECEGSD